MRGRKKKMPFFLKKLYKGIFGDFEKSSQKTKENGMLSVSNIMEIRSFSHSGTKSIYLCEAEKILKYNEGEIVLRLRRESVSFFGEALLLTGFRSGTVEVTGRIKEIVFGSREKK